MPDKKLLLTALGGRRPTKTPLWLMRQAGRYLPEYRALRADKGDFLSLVYDSNAAAEVTLQPIRRFGFDAAILFADILLVPQALGQKLWFEAGEGPRLAPRLIDAPDSDLRDQPTQLSPVYDTIKMIRDALGPETTLIGFAGAPWTVATYMLNGAGSKEQAEARRFAYAEPDKMTALIARIVDATVSYLDQQIRAGAEAVQIFESWSGSLSPEGFARWVIAPNAQIVTQLRARHPDIPIIAFPKGAGGKLERFIDEVQPNAIGLDETVDPHWAARHLPSALPVQGNLDPLALVTGGDSLRRGVGQILDAFAGRPHIFNLGHGILPDTPIDHVETLVDLVRSA